MWGIELDSPDQQPMKRRIYEHVRDLITSGQLPAGEALPSTRALSAQLGVSRSTVGEAYDMLIAEGYVLSHQGAPTRVAEGLGIGRQVPAPPTAAHPPRQLRVDFRTGRPDLRQFPQYLWRQYLRKTAEDLPIELYGYTGPQGLPVLRGEIAAWLARSRGLAVSPDDIFITAGATHALHLLCGLLSRDGKRFLMEDPCHSGMLHTILSRNCPVTPVPADAHGLCTQYLPDGRDACAVYVTPSHQFPLGGILPASRRAALIRYARENALYIIEDDYDSEFRYCGKPIAPLCTMDPLRVIYVGTFSKTLFPALRIGFVLLPEPLRRSWRDLRTHADVQNPPFEQAALAEFLRERKLDRHIQKMRKLYGQRRQVLLRSLEESFGDRLTVYGDDAGLHLAVEFPGQNFDEAFAKDCLLSGIAVTPVETHCIEKGRHAGKLLLGYGHLEPEEIRRCVALLHTFIKCGTASSQRTVL